MNKEPNFELGKNQEMPPLLRVQELFRAAEISDYTYEEQADGIHFKIKTTPEHIEERRKQMSSLLGGLEPTQFEKDKLIPLKKLLLQEQGLRFNFIGISPRAGYMEVVVYKKHE